MYDVRSLNMKFANWPDEWPLISGVVLVGEIVKMDVGCIATGGYSYVGGIILLEENTKRRYSVFFYPGTELFGLLEMNKPKVGDQITLKYLSFDGNGHHFDVQVYRFKDAEGATAT